MNESILHQHAEQILTDALQSVDPYNLIHEQIKKDGDTLKFPDGNFLDLNAARRIIVIGAGKGTAPMARAMEELLGEHLTSGSITVKYDHLDQLKTIDTKEAAHPVLDQNTLIATQDMLSLLKDLSDEDVVIVLLTGGGSALMENMPDEISLKDLQELSRVLLACSATIHEINCIRKQISLVKGGQLARIISPARCITLALSDVIGDDLSVIASGPTSPDHSTFNEALAIIEKYDVSKKIPQVILNRLISGSKGIVPETPKPGDTLFNTVSNIVIGNNRLALLTAQDKARQLGYETLIFTSMLDGEAREIAKMIAAIMKEIQESNLPIKRPACLLFGGEPTVHIRGNGKGGRNQELALAVALCGIKLPYLFVSCGSDGTDGPTDAAGAIITQDTLAKAKKQKLNPLEYLNNNDAYHFFEAINELIKTGPTRTNVMDLVIALIPE